MIKCAPSLYKIIILVLMLVFAIYGKPMLKPVIKLGFNAVSSEAIYGSPSQPSSNVIYSVSGLEIEGGIRTNWFSVNGILNFAGRTEYPTRGKDGLKMQPSGSPMFYGGGISLYLEKLKLPPKSNRFYIKFAPGAKVGYWLNESKEYNSALQNYETKMTNTFFAGLIRIDTGYKNLAAYIKGGLYDFKNTLLSVGLSYSFFNQ